MYFRNYGLRKKRLGKYLKSLVSDDASTSNMVKEPIHCFILDDSTFTIFINDCESNWVGKGLF